MAGVGWAARAITIAERPLAFETAAADTADATQTLLVWLTGLTAVALALAFLRISYLPRTFAVVAVGWRTACPRGWSGPGHGLSNAGGRRDSHASRRARIERPLHILGAVRSSHTGCCSPSSASRTCTGRSLTRRLATLGGVTSRVGDAANARSKWARLAWRRRGSRTFRTATTDWTRVREISGFKEALSPTPGEPTTWRRFRPRILPRFLVGDSPTTRRGKTSQGTTMPWRRTRTFRSRLHGSETSFETDQCRHARSAWPSWVGSSGFSEIMDEPTDEPRTFRSLSMR